MLAEPIKTPYDLWEYKKRSEWVFVANQDVKVQQVVTNAIVIRPNGQQETMQFGVTKAISCFGLRKNDIKAMEEVKEKTAEWSFKHCLDDYFWKGHYAKDKAHYNTYDCRYGPTEFSEEDLRDTHYRFYRHVWYPIKEHFRVWKYNIKIGRNADFERNGKFWFKYQQLLAVKPD